MPEIQAILADALEMLKPLDCALNLAEPEAAQAGTPENDRPQPAARIAYLRFGASLVCHAPDWAGNITHAGRRPLAVSHFVQPLAA